MAGSRIKGTTVEIGGDTTGLDKVLKGDNSTIRTRIFWEFLEGWIPNEIEKNISRLIRSTD